MFTVFTYLLGIFNFNFYMLQQKQNKIVKVQKFFQTNHNYYGSEAVLYGNRQVHASVQERLIRKRWTVNDGHTIETMDRSVAYLRTKKGTGNAEFDARGTLQVGRWIASGSFASTVRHGHRHFTSGKSDSVHE